MQLGELVVQVFILHLNSFRFITLNAIKINVNVTWWSRRIKGINSKYTTIINSTKLFQFNLTQKNMQLACHHDEIFYGMRHHHFLLDRHAAMCGCTLDFICAKQFDYRVWMGEQPFFRTFLNLSLISSIILICFKIW